MDLLKNFQELVDKELNTIQSDEDRIENITKAFRDSIYLYEAQGNTLFRTDEEAYNQLKQLVDDSAEEWSKDYEKLLYEDEEPFYDIEYFLDNRKNLKSVRLLLAGGGPTVYLNTQTGLIEGFWGSDRYSRPFSLEARDAIDSYFEEFFE